LRSLLPGYVMPLWLLLAACSFEVGSEEPAPAASPAPQATPQSDREDYLVIAPERQIGTSGLMQDCSTLEAGESVPQGYTSVYGPATWEKAMGFFQRRCHL